MPVTTKVQACILLRTLAQEPVYHRCRCSASSEDLANLSRRNLLEEPEALGARASQCISAAVWGVAGLLHESSLFDMPVPIKAMMLLNVTEKAT